MSDRIGKLRAKQGNGQSGTAPAPKKDKPLVMHTCGHQTHKGKPDEICGPCKNKADVEAALERRKTRRNPQEPSVPKFKRLDAAMTKAGRLPDGATFTVSYDAKEGRWAGFLQIDGLPPLKDSSSGVFKLLTKLDYQFRRATADNGPSAETLKREGDAAVEGLK